MVFTVYLRPDQIDALRSINAQTQVPVAVMVRNAIDDHIQRVGKEAGLRLKDVRTNEVGVNTAHVAPRYRLWTGGNKA